MARPPLTSRCGGLDASSGSRGSETTLWRCAALFGEWLVTNNLSDTNQAERAAAMWAAANRDDFDTARAAGNARTHGPPAHTGRCGGLADTAQRALERVASGETDTIEGWLAYGAALNEGRGLFSGNLEFGRWVALCQLDTTDRHERAAAMWAAANQDDFDTARAAGNARTHGPPRPHTGGGLASGGVTSVTGCYFCSGNTQHFDI